MASSNFIDANVLLEVLLMRTGQKLAESALVEGSKSTISALSGHLVFHFCKNQYDRQKLQDFLHDFDMQPLTPADFEWAYQFGDAYGFEDALQVAVAIRSGCDEFITFDQKLARRINKQGIIKARLVR
jgi:predicted nucleic acid-binding protein